MTGSYKIALVAAAALFLFILGSYLFQGDGQPDRPEVDPASDDAQPSPSRENLTSLPRAETRAPSESPPAPPAPSAGPDGASSDNADRMAELRNRLANARRSSPTPPQPPAATQPAPSRDQPPAIVLDGPDAPTPTPVFLPQPQPVAPPPAPAVATTTTPPAAPARTYTVQPGDTLSSIADDLYDNDRRWVDIAQANPTVDPIRLKVGQVLKLPPEEELRETDSPRAAAPGSVVVYTVRPGDNLSSIAEQYYGDPTLWRFIFNANRDQLGNNPDRIQGGMKLQIPPAPRLAE